MYRFYSKASVWSIGFGNLSWQYRLDVLMLHRSLLLTYQKKKKSLNFILTWWWSDNEKCCIFQQKNLPVDKLECTRYNFFIKKKARIDISQGWMKEWTFALKISNQVSTQDQSRQMRSDNAVKRKLGSSSLLGDKLPLSCEERAIVFWIMTLACWIILTLEKE